MNFKKILGISLAVLTISTTTVSALSYKSFQLTEEQYSAVNTAVIVQPNSNKVSDVCTAYQIDKAYVYDNLEDSSAIMFEIGFEPTTEPTIAPTTAPTIAPTTEPTIAPTPDPESITLTEEELIWVAKVIRREWDSYIPDTAYLDKDLIKTAQTANIQGQAQVAIVLKNRLLDCKAHPYDFVDSGVNLDNVSVIDIINHGFCGLSRTSNEISEISKQIAIDVFKGSNYYGQEKYLHKAYAYRSNAGDFGPALVEVPDLYFSWTSPYSKTSHYHKFFTYK